MVMFKPMFKHVAGYRFKNCPRILGFGHLVVLPDIVKIPPHKFLGRKGILEYEILLMTLNPFSFKTDSNVFGVKKRT